jgi:hypothetical protein
VLDVSTLGAAADINPVIKFLPHTVNHVTLGVCPVTTMSRGLPQLRRRIVETVAAIDRQMLQHMWQELDYRIDICRVTKGGYIEHL